MFMPRRSRFALLAITLPAALGLAACGTTVIDSDKTEAAIEKGLKEQADIKATATCPDDVEAKAGGTFECDVKASEGSKAKVKVTMKDDEGNVKWELQQ